MDMTKQSKVRSLKTETENNPVVIDIALISESSVVVEPFDCPDDAITTGKIPDGAIVLGPDGLPRLPND